MRVCTSHLIHKHLISFINILGMFYAHYLEMLIFNYIYIHLGIHITIVLSGFFCFFVPCMFSNISLFFVSSYFTFHLPMMLHNFICYHRLRYYITLFHQRLLSLLLHQIFLLCCFNLLLSWSHHSSLKQFVR